MTQTTDHMLAGPHGRATFDRVSLSDDFGIGSRGKARQRRLIKRRERAAWKLEVTS